MAKKIKITQVKSIIGSLENQKRTIKALGLKINKTVVRPDNPNVRGMINTVIHLVKVQDVDGE
jgi:large subunit ribosomal protein L30